MDLLLDRLIAVVLALTGLEIKPNPKADGADVLLAYAVPDAEMIFAYDGKPLITDNYPAFLKLPDSPLFATSPRARAIIRESVTVVEQARVAMKQQLGSDPLAYLGSSVIFFVNLPATEGADPTILVATRLRGISNDATLEVLKADGGTETTIDGRRAMVGTDGRLTGIARDGTILVGTDAWVRPRLAAGWKTPPRPKGSALAAIATALDARPFLTAASIPSAASIAQVRAEAGQGFASDLYAGHTFAVLSASSTGLAFTYQARDADFAARVKLATAGTLEVLRAAHLAPRSALQLAAAALPSYAGKHQVLDELLAARQPILDALTTMSGDGRFAAKVTLDGTRVTATARGKRISDVVPANVVLAFGALVYLFADDDDDAVPAPAAPPPPPPKRRPATGERGDPAKRAR